ncbi:MAG: superoxide dismutase [Rikenellaceae bacterium]|nr:superoxide dismutase [Rikenellaceae bacterium]
MAKFELPPLPYPYNALEPQISEETMHFHHDKHHKAYVDKLNELIEGTEYEKMTLEEIVQKSEGPVFNNAAQVWNHTFFFETLSPNPKQRPQGALAEAIDRDFGSLDQLAAQLKQAGVGQFGSGWAWLVKDSFGKLTVKATPNAVNPLKEGEKAILTIDVWEHAYYIDYRNRRPDFLSAAWERIDWNIVEKRYNGQ